MPGPRAAAAWAGVAVSAAGVAAGFEVASECSDAQVVLLLGGIVGTLVFAGLHSGFSAWARGPSVGPSPSPGPGWRRWAGTS